MKRNTTGTSAFVFASILLWGVTAYLLSRHGGSPMLHTFGLATGFVAFVLTLHTILYAMLGNRKALEADWFRRHGRPVEAEIIHIGRRGRRSAWRVKARCVDRASGKETVFKSDILRSNPGRKLAVGGRIVVHLHPTDPRRYWMDVGVASEYL